MRLSELINTELHKKWDSYVDHVDATLNPEASVYKHRQESKYNDRSATEIQTKASPQEEEKFSNKPESLETATPGYRGYDAAYKRSR